MSSKNKTEVLIAGKIFTLSGYESEEYLQKVATYINNKIAEFKKLDGYNHQTKENKSILLELNIADDYFRRRSRSRWWRRSFPRRTRNSTISSMS